MNAIVYGTQNLVAIRDIFIEMDILGRTIYIATKFLKLFSEPKTSQNGSN